MAAGLRGAPDRVCEMLLAGVAQLRESFCDTCIDPFGACITSTEPRDRAWRGHSPVLCRCIVPRGTCPDVHSCPGLLGGAPWAFG